MRNRWLIFHFCFIFVCGGGEISTTRYDHDYVLPDEPGKAQWLACNDLKWELEKIW